MLINDPINTCYNIAVEVVWKYVHYGNNNIMDNNGTFMVHTDWNFQTYFSMFATRIRLICFYKLTNYEMDYLGGMKWI